MASEQKDTIIVPESAILTVDGTEYDIAQVHLQLTLNAVPVCELCIEKALPDNSSAIEALNLISLKKLASELGAKAMAHAPATLEMKFQVKDASGKNGGMEYRDITLKDWVMLGCGMDGVNPVSPFSITCVLAHPAIQLAINPGCVFTGIGALGLCTKVDQVTDPVSAGELALEAMQEGAKVRAEPICKAMSDISTPVKEPDDVTADLDDMLDNAISLLPKVLKWDTAYSGGEYDIPGEGIKSPQVEYGVKMALMSSWTPPVGDSTLWGQLTRVRGDFALDIIPTYREKQLTVCPSNPYGGPSLTIEDNEAFSLNMPAYDPDPVYGAIIYTPGGLEDSAASVTYAELAKAGAGLQPANLAFIPTQSQPMRGRLMHVNDPGWLEMAIISAAGKPEMEVDGNGSITWQEVEDEVKEERLREAMEDWNLLRFQFLATWFMLEYRQRIETNIGCPLCVSKDKDPLPGSILSFTTEGEELFKGKITQVEHEISFERSTGKTYIQVRWCDTDNGASSVIGKTPVIPLYGTTGNVGK